MSSVHHRWHLNDADHDAEHGGQPRHQSPEAEIWTYSDDAELNSSYRYWAPDLRAEVDTYASRLQHPASKQT